MSGSPATSARIAGAPPTADDEMWLKAGVELTPAKSLDRIEASARFTFGGVAVLGTVLSGLSAFAGGQLSSHIWTVLPTIVLTALSLAAAARALVPHSQRVHLSDVASIRDYYERELAQRGRLVTVAGTLFALALLALALPAVVLSVPKQRDPSGPTISLTINRGGVSPTLAVRIHARGLEADGFVNTNAAALIRSRGNHASRAPRVETVLIAREVPNANGRVESRSTVQLPRGVMRVTITARAVSHGETIGRQSVAQPL